MPTILDLFKNKDSYKFGTEYNTVKADKETLVEQESSGLRVKSAVELNNPAIYGTETLRIALQSTSTLDKMKKNRTSTAEDSNFLRASQGVLNTAANVATSNLQSVLSKNETVSNLANTILGMSTRQIPTTVYNRIIAQGDKYDTSVPVQPDGTSSEVGKLLTSVITGPPETISRRAVSKGIGFAKDKVREKLFGIPTDLDGVDVLGYKQKFSNKFTKSKYEADFRIRTLENYRGVSSDLDLINTLTPSDEYTIDDSGEITLKDGGKYKDLIPFYIQHIGDSKPTMFRANLMGISETVSPTWSSHKFLGNPFNFYTYGGVERSVQFNLQIYAGSKAELATNWEKISLLTGMTYPRVLSNTLVNPPIIKFRLGDIYKNKYGYIESLSYTFPDNGVWETEEDGHALPKFIEASITIKFIESVGMIPDGPYGYRKSTQAIDAANQQLQQNTVNTNPVTTNLNSSTATSPNNVTNNVTNTTSVSNSSGGALSGATGGALTGFSSNVLPGQSTINIQSSQAAEAAQNIQQTQNNISYLNEGGKMKFSNLSLTNGIIPGTYTFGLGQSSINNKLGAGTIYQGLLQNSK